MLVLVDEGEVLVALCLVAEEVVELGDVLIELQASLARFSMFGLLDGHAFKVVVQRLLVLVKAVVCQSNLG